MNDQIDIRQWINFSGFFADAEAALQYVDKIKAALQKGIKADVSIQGINNAKTLRDSIEQLTSANKLLASAVNDVSKSQTESVKAAKTVTDAYGLLKKEVAEAERYHKNMVALFKEDSIQAKEAAEKLALLRERLNDVNTASKNVGKISVNVDTKTTNTTINGGTNIAQIEEENLRALTATGTVVSELDKLEAEAANEATAFGVAQKEVTEILTKQAAAVEAVVIPYQEYTGSLQANIAQGIQYTERLAEISAELKSGAGDTAALVLEQKELKIALTDVNEIVTAQIKYLQAAEGGYKQMGAQLLLAKKAAKDFNEEEATTITGSAVVADIQKLDKALKDQSATFGESQRNVGNYSGAIDKAILRLSSFDQVGARLITSVGRMGIHFLAFSLIMKSLDVVAESVEETFSKLDLFSNKLSDTAQQQKLLNDVTEKASDSYGRERAELDTLILKLQDEHIPRQQKLEILNELQKKYPGYFDQIKTEKDLVDKLPEAYEKAALGILLKAKAEAAQGIIGENYKKRLDAEIDYNKKREESARNYQKSVKGIEDAIENSGLKQNGASLLLASTIGQYESALQTIGSNYGDTVKQIDKDNNFLISSITNSNDEILKLGGKVDKPKPSKEKDVSFDAAIKARYESLQKDAKARYELLKQSLQDEADLQKAFASSDVGVGLRVAARKEEAEKEKEVAELETQFELHQNDLKIEGIKKVAEYKASKAKTSGEKDQIMNAAQIEVDAATLSENQVKKIKQEGAKKILDIENKLFADTIAIRQQDEADNKSRVDKEIQQYRKDQDDKLKAAVDVETKAYEKNEGDTQRRSDKELTALNEQYAAGAISKQKYEQKKKDIENAALAESLQNQITYFTNLIALYDLDADAKEKALNKIAALQKQLSALHAKQTEDNTNKDLTKLQRLVEAVTEYGNILANLATGLNDAGAQKRLNQIQDERDAMEDRYSREKELISESVVNATDRQKQLDDLDKKHAAQQRVLNQQEKQEKQKQAEFDKKAAIFKIIINTARAVIEALPDVPLSIASGVAGASELAVAIATPVPRYEFGKGASDNYEGLAVWGEKRSELRVREDGSMEIGPNRPSLTYVKSSDVIYPDAKKALAEMNKHINKAAAVDGKAIVINESITDYGELRKDVMRSGSNIVQAIKNQPKPKAAPIDWLKLWVGSSETGESFYKRMNGR